MIKSVLVTGGFGFLGRAVAQEFHARGCRVHGLGRGHWPAEDARQHGFASWLDAGVSLSSLMNLKDPIDVVVHCAGGSSVGYSVENPLEDFSKTVLGTADLLEFLRLNSPSTRLVYPSSAAVYGAKDDIPIRETDSLTPISPYGFHKKIVEDLLTCHARNYGIKVVIIRFFSIYGPGLTKQLLWDAGLKLRAAGSGEAVFWGTGEETRDWINSSDAASLVWQASQTAPDLMILNGAGGRRVTVRDTLLELHRQLRSSATIVFNDHMRAGDPRFYHADISRAGALGWEPRVSLREGVSAYVRWLERHLSAS